MEVSYSILIGTCFIMSSIANILQANDIVKECFALLIVLLNIFIVLVCIYKESNGNKTICVTLIISFILRILFLLLDLYGRNIFILPSSGNDTEMFHAGALTFPNFTFEKNPYAYVVGIIYSFALKQRLIGQYFNLLFSMSTISICIKIFDEFKIDDKVKLLVISIIAFLPNYMITSVILLRESLMIFLLSASLLNFVRWWKYNRIYNFIFSILLVLASSTFHSGVIANAAGYIITFILCNNKERKFRFTFKSTILVFVFSIILSIFFSGDSNLFTSKFGNIEKIEDITYRSEIAISGDAAYNVGGNVISIVEFIKNSPIKIFYFLTSPLPWEWRGINDVISFVFSSLFFIICYVYALKSLKKVNYNNSGFIKVCLILAFISAFIFSWGTSNAGTAMRHRDKFLVNYIVMLALSLDCIKKNELIKVDFNGKL